MTLFIRWWFFLEQYQLVVQPVYLRIKQIKPLCNRSFCLYVCLAISTKDLQRGVTSYIMSGKRQNQRRKKPRLTCHNSSSVCLISFYDYTRKVISDSVDIQRRKDRRKGSGAYIWLPVRPLGHVWFYRQRCLHLAQQGLGRDEEFAACSFRLNWLISHG